MENGRFRGVAEPERNTVDSLKDAIKAKKSNDLAGIDADHIIVYEPGTSLIAPPADGPVTPSTKPLDASNSIDAWNSAENPYEFDLPWGWGTWLLAYRLLPSILFLWWLSP